MPEEIKLTDTERPAPIEKQAGDVGEAARLAKAESLEQAAGAALTAEGESDTSLDAKESNPESIAKKYIDTVSEGDREITSPEQMTIILYALEGVLRGDLVSTKDKLGNLPKGFPEAIINADRQKAIDLARAFASDPIKSAADTDKVQEIANSELPESVRRALLAIILQEGSNSAQQAFGELANRLKSNAAETITKVVESVREDRGVVSGDSDNVRRAALEKFLEGVYPDLVHRKDVLLLRRMESLPFEAADDPKIIADIVGKTLDAIGGDYAFDPDSQSALGGSKNALELAAGIKDGTVNLPGFLVLGILPEVVKDFIKKTTLSGN